MGLPYPNFRRSPCRHRRIPQPNNLSQKDRILGAPPLFTGEGFGVGIFFSISCPASYGAFPGMYFCGAFLQKVVPLGWFRNSFLGNWDTVFWPSALVAVGFTGNINSPINRLPGKLPLIDNPNPIPMGGQELTTKAEPLFVAGLVPQKFKAGSLWAFNACKS
jgi:hypothetical protein